MFLYKANPLHHKKFFRPLSSRIMYALDLHNAVYRGNNAQKGTCMNVCPMGEKILPLYIWKGAYKDSTIC